MNADNELYKQFSQEYAEVQALAERIEGICGYTIEVRPTSRAPKWGFYAKYEDDRDPKNFAYARYRKRAKCLRISTNQEWAEDAGLQGLWHGASPKGWFHGNRPAVWWDMVQDNVASQKRVATFLAGVCNARR